MRKLLLTHFFLFSFLQLYAQVLRRPIPAACNGLGAYSQNQVDVFSFTANQAALAQQKNIAAGLYGERRFMLAELSNYTGVFALPTSSGNFGLKAAYSGFSDYNETQIGLAYARKLGTKLDIGAQFNYYGLRIAENGNATAIGFEAGAILHLTEKLHTGFQISNPVGGKFGTDKQEKLASLYSFGIGYDASEKFLVSMEVQKEEDQPVNINAGLQYKFIPQLMARAGVSSATSTIWIGCGLSLKLFRFDISAAYHSQLGITPALALLFNFKSKTN